MKDKGWVKIWRKVQENILWTSEEPYTRREAWTDLIILANYADSDMIRRDGTTITVHAGQLFTSNRKLAERWHWSIGKVERYIKLLERQKMCSVYGTSTGTLITLINYAKYQGSGDSGDDGKYAGDGADRQPYREAIHETDGQRKRIIKKDYKNTRIEPCGSNPSGEVYEK